MERDKKKKKELLNYEMKSMLGPCMVSFSIPLIVPGLTLTLVAFSDETGFSKWGVLHILGIVFLVISVVLLVIGCVLRCLWKPRVSPDLERHLSPYPSFIGKSRDKLQDSDAAQRHETLRKIYTGSGELTTAPSDHRRNPQVSDRGGSSGGSGAKANVSEDIDAKDVMTVNRKPGSKDTQRNISSLHSGSDSGPESDNKEYKTVKDDEADSPQKKQSLIDDRGARRKRNRSKERQGQRSGSDEGKQSRVLEMPWDDKKDSFGEERSRPVLDKKVAGSSGDDESPLKQSEIADVHVEGEDTRKREKKRKKRKRRDIDNQGGDVDQDNTRIDLTPNPSNDVTPDIQNLHEKKRKKKKKKKHKKQTTLETYDIHSSNITPDPGVISREVLYAPDLEEFTNSPKHAHFAPEPLQPAPVDLTVPDSDHDSDVSQNSAISDDSVLAQYTARSVQSTEEILV